MMQQLATQRSQFAALPENPATRDTAQSAGSVLPVSGGQTVADSAHNTVPAADSFADVLARYRQRSETKSEQPQHEHEHADISAVAQREVKPTDKPQAENTPDKPGSDDTESLNVSNATPTAMPGKVKEPVDESAANSGHETDNGTLGQQSVQERVEDVTQGDSDIADIAVVSDILTTGLQGGEPDYLAMVDAIRALQDKLDTSGKSQASPKADDVVSILPTEIGKPMDSELLNKMQDWLNNLMAGELPADIQATPLQQMRGAERVLSDFLALINQLQAKGSGDEDTAADKVADTAADTTQTEAELMAMLASSGEANNDAEPVKGAEDLAEDNILALAVALLEGLPGQRKENRDSVQETDAGLNAEADDLSAQSDSQPLQLSETSVEIAVQEDDSLVNQAQLLVSLMRLVQQDAATASANNTAPTDGKAAAVTTALTGMDGLTSMLEQASDKTIEQLAQVMTDSAAKASPTLTDTQLSQIRSQLTSGLEEMRAQLKQGHEPGIDLAALVKLTVQDVAPDSTQNIALPVLKDMEQLTQLAAMAGISQVQEQQITELVNVARDVLVHETRQQHGDTLKSLQQQAVFDKPVNVQQPEGQKELAEKIRWMVNGRQSMAEIRLDPPEMGSMQIRLNVSGDSASVSFVVQSQHAKEALADAMPRLRDMFSEQGLDLGESFVSQQNSGEAGDGETAGQQGGGFAESELDETNSQETHVVRPANGLIDDYV